MTRNGPLRRPLDAAAARLRPTASFIRHLPARFDDLRSNQAVLAQALARYELEDFQRPCADPPMASRVCRQADLGREHVEWARALDEPLVFSRKTWEYTAICRALDQAGMLQPGKRGLGFGVGREALPAAFASRQVDVVATDLSTEDPRAKDWLASDEHARRRESLARPFCPPDLFDRHIKWRSVDMNAIPDDLTGFDFVWSSCAFEHLGSIDAGFRFVTRAMECLAPGGIAVHTTEYNLDSDDSTVSEGPTVAFRNRDLSRLLMLLQKRGHQVGSLLVGERAGILDRFIDIPPYSYSALVLRLGPYRITSAVIIAQA